MQRGIVWVIGVFFLWAMSVPAVWGDATVDTFFKSGGVKGMGVAEGMMTHRIQGEKKWESSDLKFTGAFLSKLAGETEHGYHHPGGQSADLDPGHQKEDLYRSPDHAGRP